MSLAEAYEEAVERHGRDTAYRALSVLYHRERRRRVEKVAP